MDLKIKRFSPTNLYTCGPTVYDFAHLGNLRSYIFADIVYRSKIFLGHKVNWVMNITDIDDKTIKKTIDHFGSQAGPKELEKYTETYYQIFLQDLKKLNVASDKIRFIKVSEVISPIQDFIVKLLNQGYAYKADDDSVYFKIEKYQQDFGHYGQLVGEKFLTGKKIGARVKVDEYEKDELSDFALWKAREPNDGQIFWSHPLLGDGRPGWHIECSAINYFAFKGQITDIHTGGIDLLFPHHTNEIAQSEALTGQTFVRQWLHSEHLLVDGRKMSKSLNNLLTLADLEQKNLNPLAYRYLLLQAGHSQKINFTWESMSSAMKGYDNLKNKISKLKNQTTESTKFWPNLQSFKTARQYSRDFKKQISSLNTASALATLQTVITDKNLTSQQKLKLVANFDLVFGLEII